MSTLGGTPASMLTNLDSLAGLLGVILAYVTHPLASPVRETTDPDVVVASWLLAEVVVHTVCTSMKLRFATLAVAGLTDGSRLVLADLLA